MVAAEALDAPRRLTSGMRRPPTRCWKASANCVALLTLVLAPSLRIDVNRLVVPDLPVAVLVSWAKPVQYNVTFSRDMGVGLSAPGQPMVYLPPTRIRWTEAAVAHARQRATARRRQGNSAPPPRLLQWTRSRATSR